MKSEKLKALANALRGIKNELDEAGKAKLEEIAAAVVALAEDADDDGKAEIDARLEQLRADLAKVQAEAEERTADKLQKLSNSLASLRGGDEVKNKITNEVRAAVAHAVLNATGMEDVKKRLNEIASANGIELRKRNSLTGMSYADFIDYALQLKQEDNDEIFDALRTTRRNKWFFGELDSTNPNHIAKQWNGITEEQATKLIQELALEGKSIATAYIYKMQQIDNTDLDDARDAGQEAELENDLRNELRKAVKALIVRAIMVGDTYNGNGSKVTVFETIGTKTTSDLFTTVVAPAAAGVITLADVRKTAAAVKTERKWAVMTEELKLALATRKYAEGGTEFFFTDAELAAQLGVDRVIAKDFVGEVTGLHAIVFDPSEYWRKEKNTIDVAFPDYRNNTKGYIYELNTGGAIHGLQSTAILKSSESAA